MKFNSALYKTAGFNSTDVANLFGVSRVTGYRWLKGTSRAGAAGVGVNIFLQDRVAATTASLARAVDKGLLPDAAVAALPPGERATKITAILADVANS